MRAAVRFEMISTSRKMVSSPHGGQAAEKADRLPATVALKRLPQPVDLEAGAKQREQASVQDHPAFGRQQKVDAGIEIPEHA